MISKAKREKTLHLVAVCDEMVVNAEKLKKKALALLNSAIIQSWDDFDVLVGRRLKDFAHRQINPAGDGLPASD